MRRGASRAEVVSTGAVGLPVEVSEDIPAGGTLCVRERIRVIAASACERQLELMFGNEDRVDADRVRLATGTRVDFFADRSMRFVRESLPTSSTTQVLLDPELCWPGSTIHVVGPGGMQPGPSGRGQLVGRVESTELVVEAIERSLTDSPSRVQR